MDFNRLLKKLMFWKKEPEKIIILKVPEKQKPKLIDPRKLRIHYICARCKYKFSRNPNMDVDVCPYCGRKGTVEEQ
ncbi:MAG: hypothetical protein Q7J54_05925 [Candidatus Woesearchaeota archaeon]|nr:hypothetical protein [Candidatus Woesearchaeota archaeon]